MLYKKDLFHKSFLYINFLIIKKFSRSARDKNGGTAPFPLALLIFRFAQNINHLRCVCMSAIRNN